MNIRQRQNHKYASGAKSIAFVEFIASTSECLAGLVRLMVECALEVEKKNWLLSFESKLLDCMAVVSWT